MSHTFGQCQGTATRHLPPQVGRPIAYPRGPFHADLTPTVWTKLRGQAPGPLFLGLLTRPPNPDGDHYEELRLPGGERPPLEITPLDGRYETNANHVSFAIPAGSPPVLHIGLFDAEGVLRYYGRLVSTRSAIGPALAFEFRPYAIRLIRLRPQDVAVSARF